jgi:hypothetical protein
MTDDIDDMDAGEVSEKVDIKNIQQKIHDLVDIPESGTDKVNFSMREGHPSIGRDRQLCYDKMLLPEFDAEEVCEEVRSLGLDIGDTVVVEVDVDDCAYEILGKGDNG